MELCPFRLTDRVELTTIVVPNSASCTYAHFASVSRALLIRPRTAFNIVLSTTNTRVGPRLNTLLCYYLIAGTLDVIP